MRAFLCGLSGLAALVSGVGSSNLRLARLLQNCGQSCDNNGGCQNGSQCNLNDAQCVWCSNCPAGYSGERCEIAPATTSGCGQSCANNGTPTSCQNGSQCNLNAQNCIYCSNCPAGYSGERCEIAPANAPTPAPVAGGCGQTCANNGTPNPCQNGSQCNLNGQNCIYCSNCPTGYSGYRCEVPPAGTSSISAPTKIPGQVCGSNNGADSVGGACMNNSKCTLNDAGYVYCTGCPAGYTGDRCETPSAGSTSAPTVGSTPAFTCASGTPCGAAGSYSGSYNNNTCCSAEEVCASSESYGGGRGGSYSTGCLPACSDSNKCAQGTCQTVSTGQGYLSVESYSGPYPESVPVTACICPRTTGYTGPACDVLVQNTCPTAQTACGGYADQTTGALTGGTCCTSDQACIAVGDFSANTVAMQCVAKSTAFTCSGAGEIPCGAAFLGSGYSTNADYRLTDNSVCCSATQQCVQLGLNMEGDGAGASDFVPAYYTGCQ